MTGTNAVYFDGVSAGSKSVNLEISTALILRDEDGIEIDRWQFSDLRRVETAPGLYRLSNAKTGARIETRDEAFVAQIERLVPVLAHEPGTTRKTIAKVVFWSIAAVVSISLLLIYGSPILARQLVPLISPEYERRLGDSYSNIFIDRMLGGERCQIEEGPGRDALNKMLARVTTNYDGPYELRVVVVKHKMVNAFALPGGLMVFTDSIIKLAKRPEEMAAVLAHEIGHVVHRHGLHNMVSATATSIILGFVLGDVTGGAALVIAAEHMINSSNTREAERQADTFAIEMLRNNAIHPRHEGAMFARLRDVIEGIDRMPEIFSTHPGIDSRIERANKAKGPANEKPVLTDKEWDTLQAICD